MPDGVEPAGVLDRARLDLLVLPVELRAYAQILATLGVGGYRDELFGEAEALDVGGPARSHQDLVDGDPLLAATGGGQLNQPLVALPLHPADPALQNHPDALAGEGALEEGRGVPVLPSEELSRLLEALRNEGVRVAIDDFGTGYSSLSYLQQMPFDVIKIDQSFIRELSEGSNDTAISTAIIALAHSLDLDVVAEGIETDEQLWILQDLGCDIGQGFLFARPMPAEACTKLFDRELSPAAEWLITFARKRNEKSMAQKLASEILAAAKEEGAAVKKRVDTHKMAEANKAFSHFRF